LKVTLDFVNMNRKQKKDNYVGKFQGIELIYIKRLKIYLVPQDDSQISL
jgi:hypothetical protein